MLTLSETCQIFLALRKRQEGQTFAEYAIVLAVLAIAIVVTLGVLSKGISGSITKVTGLLPS